MATSQIMTNKGKDLSLFDKIDSYSSNFLNTPYGHIDYKNQSNNFEETLNNLISEGEFIDSVDKLDCVTFVEVVLALTYCNEFSKSYKQLLQQIRYKLGIDSLIYRNWFFTCIDFIPNNDWLLKDITPLLCDNYKIAKTIIDKYNWFCSLPEFKSFIDNKNFNEKILKNYLEMKNIELGMVESNLPYIPLSYIIKNYEKFINAMPNAAVVNIVIPNWDMTKEIGSHLNVSHMGIVLKKDGGLIFRHATSVGPKKVVELPLIDYLIDKINPKAKGVNILKLKDIE